MGLGGAGLRRGREAGSLHPRTTAALLLCTSCLRPEGGTPPGLDPAGTILVLNLSDAMRGRPNSTLVVDAPISRYTSTDAAETYVIAYPFPPLQLGWRSGPMTLRPGGPALCGPQHRPLPITDQVWRLDEEGGWTIASDEPRLAQLCVPEPTMSECFSAGGCYRSLPDLDPAFCDLSCPTPPAPTPPAPPAPPAPPLPPQLDCPNLGPECELREALCQGPNPPPAQARGYCRHLDPSCPGGPFAPAPLGTTPVYVSSDAVGPGDGTSNAPYPDLATALEQHPGDPVLLAPGAYTTPDALPAGVWVIGACARGTQLHGELHALGALSLEGLTVDGPMRVEEASLRDVRVVAPADLETLLEVTGSLTMEGVTLEGPATF